MSKIFVDNIEKRVETYPPIGDQLDMFWKIKTTDFYTQLKAVKDANPKP